MDENNWINDLELILTPWENILFHRSEITVHILRLDLLHPVASGNKWLKLKGFIHQMKNENRTGILTQGGPWSNHIVAVAAACQQLGLRSAALLRGQKRMTATLEEAASYGMELIWTSWDDYNNPAFQHQLAIDRNSFFVPMGGAATYGRDGFVELAQRPLLQQYNHLVAAVGSGTMLAGLLLGKHESQKATGISALRLRPSTLATIAGLSSETLVAKANITDRFVGKGYAKFDDGQIGWMNGFYHQTGIATDMVYTAKTLMAVETLAQEGYFMKSERVLVVHSGGLQGNRSLAKGLLCF